MSTLPHPTAPSGVDTGVWADVADVVAALGSSLEPRQVLASVRDVLTACAGQPASVYTVDAEKGLLRDPLDHRTERLHPGLAAVLQLQSGPVVADAAWSPGSAAGGGSVLALRDADKVIAVAFFADPVGAGPVLGVLAQMCGVAIARALRFDRMARLTGDSESTRNMQQQILDHVSHEFNTPLMILRSSAGFARESSSEEERELFFDMHAQALDRLEQLVHGVIEVAHASAHGERSLLTTEDIVSQLVLPQFVDDEWPGAVPALWHRCGTVQVEVEPANLGLAIEHLVRNAQLHAAEQGAPVAVAIYPARMDQEPRAFELAIEALRAGTESIPEAVADPDAVVIEVIDAGPGVPAAELGLIFEPFTQASNSPLRGVSGAGMGLATAQRLVESAGGRLDVESLLGAGALFRIRMPAH